MSFAVLETLLGFSVFIGAVLAGRPLARFFRREPTPALLRSEVVSDLIVMGYFSTLVLGFALGLHGIL